MIFSCFEKGYRKIPKIRPRAYIFQRTFLRGLKGDRPTRLLQFVTFVYFPFSIKFGLLTYFASNVFLEGNICFELGGLIFGGPYIRMGLIYGWGLYTDGAYIQRGLFSEFYGI